MQITYGPGARHGVTSLMAVDGVDDNGGATEHALKVGTLLGVGALALGVVVGSGTLKHVGLGAALAIFGVRMARRQTVEVTRPLAGCCPRR